MLLLAETISRYRFKWNERPLTEDDFHRLCRRFKIKVIEMPLRVQGFYYSALGRHFIAIDSKLSPQKKLFVMFHELGHFLLHAPEGAATANYHGVGAKTRKESEADVFALCALIPRSHILAERSDDLVHDPELAARRTEIFRRHGL